MIDEPDEIWERHIEELLDKKLKPIKREIKQLKQWSEPLRLDTLG